MSALAFGARLVPMLLGGGLGGTGGYDDGVYYTAAAALVHGRLPYRDFLLLHPPGMLLVLAPFVWLGSATSDATGFAAARVGFMALGAVNAVLVVAVLRRFGIRAAAVGGVFYALFFPAIVAERSTLLEPLGTLALLMALLLLGPRAGVSSWRCYAAGAALGAGAAVKIWCVVPVLVVVAWQRGSCRWRVLLSAAAAVALICSPFFVAAPARMFRYVVADQVGRNGAHVSLIERVESIAGLDALASAGLGPSLLMSARLALVCVFALCVCLVYTAPTARIFVWLLAANTAVLLVSPSYFEHYSALTAAPLALSVGVGVDIAAVRAAPLLRRSPLARPFAVAAGLVAVAALGLPGVLHPEGTPFPGAALRPAAARVRGCITADDPTALVELDTLTPDLDRGCVIWPDVTGWTYDTADVRTRAGKEKSRPKNTLWQHLVLGYLQSGSAVITIRLNTGLSAASTARLDAGPVLAHASGYTLHAVPRVLSRRRSRR